MSLPPVTTSSPENSLVVPVYRNESQIPALIERLELLHASVLGGIEVVLVVDGSPDDSHQLLAAALPIASFPSRLILLSRNFGAFAAIRAGLESARGRHFAVMAADLQEPPELIQQFFTLLQEDAADLLVGTRQSRADPLGSRVAAGLFWGLYRRLVQREIPRSGVDVFACNSAFRDQLLRLGERRSSLVGQLFWLGFRRHEVPYQRVRRVSGSSAWTLGRKVDYLLDSVFSFTDLPIRLFTLVGILGVCIGVVLGLIAATLRVTGAIDVPGYAATLITVVFFGGLNLFGLGVIGSYVWRSYENTKARPLWVTMRIDDHPGAQR